MTLNRESSLLLVPAAGAGSRLQSALPKCLVPVAGRTMLRRIIELWAPWVAECIVVAAPGFAEAAALQARAATTKPVHVQIQERPTGMLDAVELARSVVLASKARRVVVTWCDQVAIHPRTAKRLIVAGDAQPGAGIVMPVVKRPDPYVHFDRDARGRISRVRQRREGDAMPDIGESDAGLFSFSRSVYLNELAAYAALAPQGSATEERNLLPFIPWFASRGEVVTFRCVDAMESVGINTPAELAAVQEYLTRREAS